MSYCRFDKNSDVYMIRSMHDSNLYCMSCRLTKQNVPTVFGGFMFNDTICKTPQEAHAHLLKHKSVKHKVPTSALQRLKREAKHFQAQND